MPARKQEAYRALELLEDYYNQLESPDDIPLKNAIDRVIKVFKSRLFQALMDIQEFYESILLDEQSDRAAKTNATRRLAEDWEHQPMLPRDRPNGAAVTTNESSVFEPIVTTNPVIVPPEVQTRKPTETPFSRLPGATKEPSKTDTRPAAEPAPSTDLQSHSYADHWREILIDLERLSGVGLGFSIAGGRDTPCINDSPAVLVTRVTDGGLAATDGRLKLHDIILWVNDIDFTDIDHQPAVDALKAAGPQIKLIVRRLEPTSLEEIDLTKPPDVYLGFSIAGGITHEHVKGDHGIFITNIIPGGITDQDGRMKIGDRLMHVQSEKSNYDLRFVEHKHAVESIRQACTEGSKIVLVVAHVTQLPPASTTNQTNGPLTINNDRRDFSSDERQVILRRGQSGFGFNLVAGDNKVFISFIPANGPAYESGQLRKGDQILSVNGIDLRGVNHEEAAATLKSCGKEANLRVIHRFDDFLRLETRRDGSQTRLNKDHPGGSASNIQTQNKRQFYVQAEFDYDPTKDMSAPPSPGLAFRVGDILHVINAADDSWWQAKRVINERQDAEEVGIIPSKSRVEKKERARQKRVNFNSGSHSRSNTLERDKDKNKKKKKHSLFNKSGAKREAQSGEESENETENLEPVLSYRVLEQHEVSYTRPVIILGPFKELLNDQLLADYPEKFSNCVPHTSRPRRDNEIDGRDYHFVASREQMERDIRNYLFIEAGEYTGNLYGTSISAVRDIANSSKHCILDVTGHAIKRLINADLHPIVIFVKARDLQWILENMATPANDSTAQQVLDKALKTQEQFGDLFTVTINGENLNDVYQRVIEAIDVEQAKDHLWVPSKDKI